MWVEGDHGVAFVPDDLSEDSIRHLPDSVFPDFWEAAEALTLTLERCGDDDIYYQMLLRREAQTFAPSLERSRSSTPAQLHHPFVPFHVFDSQEALCYAEAAQFVWESARKPYSGSFLRAVHKRLLPTQPQAGKFRQTAAGIADRGATIEDARIVFAPSDFIQPCFSKLKAFAGALPGDFRLARCAMVHFQIIAIHPFFDGNGRVARATLPALLREYGLVDAPVLFLSETLLRDSRNYYGRVLALEKYGELTAWVKCFVDLLVRQSRLSTSFLLTVDHIRRELIASFRHAGVDSGAAKQFADNVLLSPSFRLSEASAVLRMTATDAGALMRSLWGKYGLSQIVASSDPVFQFGDVYDVLCL